MTRSVATFFLILSVPFLLTACKGDEPRQPATVVKKRAPKRVKQPVAAAKAKVEGSKAPLSVGRIERNPFKPFTASVGGRKVVQPRTPLQRYQVGQLKLVAVIWGIDPPVGMLETPEGKGFVVRRGDLVGDRNGKVARVKRDRVVVVERYKDLSGRFVTKKMEIKLPSSIERGEAQ
jgi:type IV pilus assembly protein PilP